MVNILFINHDSDLNQNNYIRWLQVVTTKPHAYGMFLRRLFTPGNETCECRSTGEMFIGGNINKCIPCTDIFCTMDGHDFIGSMSTGILGWLSTVLEGKMYKKSHICI